MLLPANRTEQRWWQREVEPYRDGHAMRDGCALTTRFLASRINFVDAGRKYTSSAPFGCVFLIWEPNMTTTQED